MKFSVSFVKSKIKVACVMRFASSRTKLEFEKTPISFYVKKVMHDVLVARNAILYSYLHESLYGWGFLESKIRVACRHASRVIN